MFQDVAWADSFEGLDGSNKASCVTPSLGSGDSGALRAGGNVNGTRRAVPAVTVGLTGRNPCDGRIVDNELFGAAAVEAKDVGRSADSSNDGQRLDSIESLSSPSEKLEELKESLKLHVSQRYSNHLIKDISARGSAVIVASSERSGPSKQQDSGDSGREGLHAKSSTLTRMGFEGCPQQATAAAAAAVAAAVLTAEDEPNEQKTLMESPISLSESSVNLMFYKQIEAFRSQMRHDSSSEGDTSWELHSEIGKGAFGIVFRGVWRGLDVAIKRIILQVGGAGGPPHSICEPHTSMCGHQCVDIKRIILQVGGAGGPPHFTRTLSRMQSRNLPSYRPSSELISSVVLTHQWHPH